MVNNFLIYLYGKKFTLLLCLYSKIENESKEKKTINLSSRFDFHCFNDEKNTAKTICSNKCTHAEYWKTKNRTVFSNCSVLLRT